MTKRNLAALSEIIDQMNEETAPSLSSTPATQSATTIINANIVVMGDATGAITQTAPAMTITRSVAYVNGARMKVAVYAPALKAVE